MIHELIYFHRWATLTHAWYTLASKRVFVEEKKFRYQFDSIFMVLEVFGKCFTPDQYRGDCVYFKACPALQEIFNRRPPSTQDRLFLSLSQCGYRDGQPLVCCRETAYVAPPPPAPTQPPININNSPGPAPSSSNLLPKPGVCGIDAENRIYGGNETSGESAPKFQWSLFVKITFW